MRSQQFQTVFCWGQNLELERRSKILIDFIFQSLRSLHLSFFFFKENLSRKRRKELATSLPLPTLHPNDVSSSPKSAYAAKLKLEPVITCELIKNMIPACGLLGGA